MNIFLKKLKKENKILHIKSNFGLDMWSFKMRDFFENCNQLLFE